MKSFYHLPRPWNPGYAIPDYVMAEQPGRGAMATTWLPRGTIYGMVPEFSPIAINKQPVSMTGLGSLGDDTLGCQEKEAASMGPDPFLSYGKKASGWLMHSLKAVPSEQRAPTLRAIFDAVDPSLWVTVDNLATQLRAKGMTPPKALEQAMATSLSAGLLREIIDTGKRAMRGDRRPVATSGQLALGVYPDAVPRAQAYALEALDGIWDSIKNAAGKVGGAIAGAGSAAGHFVVNGVQTLGGLACKAVNSGKGQAVVSGSPALAAAGPYGMAAAAGIQGAQALCHRNAAGELVPGPAPGYVPPPARPAWLVPAAIGGAGLLVFLLLRK